MQYVKVERVIQQPRQAVWDTYTDHLSWNDWAQLGKVRLTKKGSPTVNGVGCVRSIKTAGIGVEEEVVEFEAPTRMVYQIVRGGPPMKNHRGEVTFVEEGDGTRVTWACHFEPTLPLIGGLLQKFITRLFARGLARLDRHMSKQGNS